MRVVHVISGLGMGGAETMVARLVRHLDTSAFETEVISLTRLGAVGETLRREGHDVRALGMGARASAPLRFAGLVRALAARPVDVVQTWLYHADLIGGIAARIATRAAVVWNIRHSDFGAGGHPRVASVCARLSRRIPRRIVSCSAVGARLHAAAGYDAGRMTVIPNGFDLGRFRVDPAARAALRAEIGVSPEAPLVGLVGRFHPQKDHATFLRAAATIAASRPDARFLLCGPEVTRENAALAAEIDRAGLGERCIAIGRRADVERIHAALDVACSSSAFGEGFSNVLGEAMACGIPCVTTDVGDAAEIVADTGRIVPRRDPAAFAAAIEDVLALDPERRRALGATARRRIERHFEISGVVARYAALYREVGAAEPRTLSLENAVD